MVSTHTEHTRSRCMEATLKENILTVVHSFLMVPICTEHTILTYLDPFGQI